MEDRITRSWYRTGRCPDRLHLSMLRGVRSEIYSLEPRVRCTTCKEPLDVINDGWYSCSKNPGSYCEECKGKHQDADYVVDGEMRKDAEEQYVYEAPPKPETFRKIRMYLAVQTVARKIELPESKITGPSYTLTAVPVGQNVRFLKGAGENLGRERSKAEKVSAYRELMARIGPDRLPPLEAKDRRHAYLESKGYKRDPAYL